MPERALAVFPYLKTSSTIELGGCCIWPSDSPPHPDEEELKLVQRVLGMLALDACTKVEQASCLWLQNPLDSSEIERLKRLQNVMAYYYSSPHKIFGDLFLAWEHCRCLVFVSTTKPVLSKEAADTGFDLDKVESRAAFRVTENFSGSVVLEDGKLIIPATMNFQLNKNQDLAKDFVDFVGPNPVHKNSAMLLSSEPDPDVDRIVLAISWYNKACTLTADWETSVLALSAAFETLLESPQTEISKTLASNVALLLGANTRASKWFESFYHQRSQIVHRGKCPSKYYLSYEIPKHGEHPSKGFVKQFTYLEYGRFVFQACLSTLLHGKRISIENGLLQKLVTNQERFEAICQVLGETSSEPSEQRIAALSWLVDDIYLSRFSIESSLKAETIYSAVISFAKVAADLASQPEAATALRSIAKGNFKTDEIGVLESITAAHQALKPENQEIAEIEIAAKLLAASTRFLLDRYLAVAAEASAAKKAGEVPSTSAPAPVDPKG